MSEHVPEHAPIMLKCDTVASEHTHASEHAPNMSEHTPNISSRTCVPEHAQKVTLPALQSPARADSIQTQPNFKLKHVPHQEPSAGVLDFEVCFANVLLVLRIGPISEHGPNTLRTC